MAVCLARLCEGNVKAPKGKNEGGIKVKKCKMKSDAPCVSIARKGQTNL